MIEDIIACIDYSENVCSYFKLTQIGGCFLNSIVTKYGHTQDNAVTYRTRCRHVINLYIYIYIYIYIF